MGKITQLKYNGEVAYPLTHTTAVVNNDGETLEQLLQNNSNTTTIIDNLESEDKTAALSANMGRVLNEKFYYSNYLEDVTLQPAGSIVPAVGWKVTDPIIVNASTALTFECGGSSSAAICEYDANDIFLDYWSQNAHPRTITTKANTAYVRLTVPSNPTQDYFVAQNDVVLFNKLRKFDIVEQVAENTQKLENIGDSVEVKVENVTDANGKPLDEILSEISAGGAEGALVYNAPQTLTDEQKSQVAKNIGQPRERLILEWTNDQAEVLQPTAYDAETGYFTVETMPSWLPTDGTPVAVTFNYIDLYTPTIQAHGSMSNHNVAWCSYISDTQFLLHNNKTDLTPITKVQSGVDVSKFYLSNNDLYTFDILPTDEQSPTSGIKKFRFEIVGAPFRLCKYKCLWVNGSPSHVQNNYNWINSGSIGHDTNCHFATRIEGYFYVDYEALSAQFTKVEQSGGSVFSNSITNFVNPTLYSNVGDLWGYANYKRCYLHCEYLEHNATVKIWEIIE